MKNICFRWAVVIKTWRITEQRQAAPDQGEMMDIMWLQDNEEINFPFHKQKLHRLNFNITLQIALHFVFDKSIFEILFVECSKL